MYDPFGGPHATTGSTSPTVGFQGDYTDPTSGETWMGARWYSGQDASFRSRDIVFGELRTPISLNRYTYGFANAMAYWDPDGREPCRTQVAADNGAFCNNSILGGVSDASVDSTVSNALTGGLKAVPDSAALVDELLSHLYANTTSRPLTAESARLDGLAVQGNRAGFEYGSWRTSAQQFLTWGGEGGFGDSGAGTTWIDTLGGQLLMIDHDAQLAIVVFGDLDAANVAVHFPGQGNSLDNIENPLSDARNLYDASVVLDEDTAVVMCLCYDPPDNAWASIVQSLLPGTRNLERTRDLLQTLQLHDDQNVTTIGHSFGARMAIEFGIPDELDRRDPPLVANQVVIVGAAPVSTTRPRGAEVYWGFAGKDGQSGGNDWLAFAPFNEPGDNAFIDDGGNQIPVNSSGHSSYFDRTSSSLHYMARIVTGQLP